MSIHLGSDLILNNLNISTLSDSNEGDHEETKKKYRLVCLEREKLVQHIKEIEAELNELRRQQNYSQHRANQPATVVAQPIISQIKIDLETKHSDQIKKLKAEHESKVAKLEDDHQLQIATMQSNRSKLEAEIQCLKNEKASLKLQCDGLKRQQEKSSLQRAQSFNAANSLSEIKKSFSESKQKNLELQDQMEAYENLKREMQEQLNTLKTFVDEKECHVRILMDENQTLNDKIEAYETKINATEPESNRKSSYDSEETVLKKEDLHELISRIFELQTHVFYQETSDRMEREAAWRLRRRLHHIELWLVQVVTQLDFLMGGNIADTVEAPAANAFSLMQTIDDSFQQLRAKLIGLNDSISVEDEEGRDFVEHNNQQLGMIERMIGQSTFIGRLIREIKSMKSAYKKALKDFEKQVFMEKEQRLTQEWENGCYCFELEKKINKLQRKTRIIKQKCLNVTKENESLHAQIKFLIKQKIHLSQQIEEYECRVVQKFHNLVHRF